MSPSNPPYKIALLPPPGPAVLSLRPPPSSSSSSQPLSPPIPQTFHDALAVRDAVFVTEQHCPRDEEIDADDAVSWHWVVYANNAEDKDPVPAATIRLVPAQAHADADDEKAFAGGRGPSYKDSRLWDHEEPYLKIGRLATRKEFRGRGYGRVLVEEALGWAGGHAGDVVRDWHDGVGERGLWKGLVLAHAQEGVAGWYRGLGWRSDEGMGRWDECGIRHVGMWRRVEIAG